MDELWLNEKLRIQTNVVHIPHMFDGFYVDYRVIQLFLKRLTSTRIILMYKRNHGGFIFYSEYHPLTCTRSEQN